MAARTSARAASAVLREHGNRAFEWLGYLALARASLQPADAAEPGEAESNLSAAMALIEQVGMRSHEPMVREAQRLFGEIGATGHVERMERTWPQLFGARA